jgi:small nuclear ribonucleoprotein (snRNP)-like protein
MVGGETPYRFLQKFLGKEIKVELKDSDFYEGLLVRIEENEHEGLGNIFLRNVKGSNYKGEADWSLIRGNNILFIYL